jgi:hypothetical protein
LLPGTSFSNPNADPCGNNVLVAASTVDPAGRQQISSVFLYNNESSQNSCAYYQAVGLITGNCAQNADGSFVNGLTMAQWESNYYVPLAGTQNIQDCSNKNIDCLGRATFVNINDLNFVRAHVAVMKSDGSAGAAFVCNYRGPDFYQDMLAENEPGPNTLNPVNQAAVDTAVQNAVGNVNPLPCVVFDYGAPDAPPLAGFDPKTNKAIPYLRMMVFTPAGKLASAVDLDGRGPKGVPNACSACHGVPYGQTLPPGPTYQTRQGASYIPFDIENLEFSSSSSPTDLTQAGQEPQIKILNEIVLKSAMAMEPNSASTNSVSALIHGWYDSYDLNGKDPTVVTTPLGNAKQQLWTPPDILLASLNIKPKSGGAPAGETLAQILVASDEVSAYIDIYGPYCRSCHVANHVDTWSPPMEPASSTNADSLASVLQEGGVCGANGGSYALMPNSKMSFDRLWTSHVGPTATRDLDVIAILEAYMQDENKTCVPHTFSNAIR